MPTQRDWDQFREQFPELAAELKTLGAQIYDMGATKGISSKELDTLFVLLSSAPKEALELLSIPPLVDRPQLLVAIFPWMATLLSNLEQGGTL